MYRLPSRLAPLALFIVACSSRSDAPATADSSVTISPPATDMAPSPAAWTMTEQGLGPLQAGMSVEQIAASVPGTFSLPPADSTVTCVYAAWSQAPAGVRVMMENGTLGRVEVTDGEVATAEGARVGDSEARIDSLYPGRVRRMPHKYTDGRYLVVLASPPADTINRLVFETDGARVTTYRAGRFPPVEYVEGCA